MPTAVNERDRFDNERADHLTLRVRAREPPDHFLQPHELLSLSVPANAGVPFPHPYPALRRMRRAPQHATCRHENPPPFSPARMRVQRPGVHVQQV